MWLPPIHNTAKSCLRQTLLLLFAITAVNGSRRTMLPMYDAAASYGIACDSFCRLPFLPPTVSAAYRFCQPTVAAITMFNGMMR
jgi:hypothetical protein